MVKNIAITVKGKVQGVWFRYFTEKEATKLGLKGFVKNQNDGSVYIEVSGPSEKVEKLEKWCHDGSPQSKVDEVLVNILDSEQTNSFHIKHN